MGPDDEPEPELSDEHELAHQVARLLEESAALRLSGLPDARPLSTWWPPSDPRSARYEGE